VRQLPAQPLPTPTAPTQQQPSQRETEQRPAPPPAFDASAVQNTLNAYADGYTNRSVESIARVYPNLPADQRDKLAQAFGAASQYGLTLAPCTIEPLSATVATALCGAKWNIRFKDGRTANRSSTLNLRLERRGSSWVITQLLQ
jgi:hypothetical protein